MSDTTNVLALEAAKRRKNDAAGHIHLAACQRVLRAQAFEGPGLFQHFRIFALVSSGRDQGSGTTESAMLVTHLGFWIRALADIIPGVSVRIEFASFDSPVLLERFRDTVLPELSHLPGGIVVEEDPARTRARGYYGSGAIRVSAGEVEIGDGGFTDWTAQLMADKKERCFISCVSTERLADQVNGLP